MASCSYCGSEKTLHVNGVPGCEACANAVRGKAARSFAEVNEALTLARQEYFDAFVGHRGDRDNAEAIRKANVEAFFGRAVRRALIPALR
jgi:hypothetical protein